MSYTICILNVAEKPSVAKEVTTILSRKQFTSIRSDSQYNPVYEFNTTFRTQPAKMHFTSVTGHIMNFEFPPNYKDWKTIDPKILLREAPVKKSVTEDKAKLATNLRRLSNQANVLVLWLDCDAEGEAIAFEVIEICKEANRNLSVYRAHFSAVTAHDINHAFGNLLEPNKRLAESIEARQEIDLRIGAAFTRFQTLTLRPRFSSLASNLISYGPCQIPTLGFVVERYKKVKNFVPESFWYIFCKYEIQDGSYKEMIEFTWNRNRIFDEYCARLLYEKCLEKPEAIVMNVNTHPKSKWRPMPLNTIELQKLAARKLHMSSARLMEIAEKLYNKGFVSYPRTETDSYLKSIDLKELIGYHAESNEWGQYATNLLSTQSTNQFLWPRNGPHNDNAHPPIHPVKLLQKSEVPLEEWRVYELITRHFLACCSQDAKGQERIIEIMINDECFTAKGILITNYNYLEVYIYDKWTEINLPNLCLSQKFIPTNLLLKEGKTSAPSLLSEADLIATMDKNGIGTDATIAEHIRTIQERGYAEKVNGGFFSPTNLGLALVESYEQMGLELAKPKLRAEMEKKMKEIVAGSKNKNDVVQESVSAMEEVYIQISSQRSVFIENVRKFYHEDNGNGAGDDERKEEEVDLGLCKNCQRNLVLMKGQYFRGLKCRSCDILMQLPKQGDFSKVNFLCPICGSQIINIKTPNNTTYYLCPWCYNNHPSDLDPSFNDRSPSKFNANMPCFKCPHTSCQYASGGSNKSLFPCEKCGKPMVIRKTKKNKFMCGCSGFPKCTNYAFLPDLISNCRPIASNCQKCKNKNVVSTLVELKFEESSNLPIELQVLLSMEEEGARIAFCLVPGCEKTLQGFGYQYGKNCTAGEAEIQNSTQRGSGDKPNSGYSGRQNSNPNVGACYKCGQKGHIAPNCPLNQGISHGNPNFERNHNNNQAKNKTKRFKNERGNNSCFNCGEEGHFSNDCPRKNINFQNDLSVNTQRQPKTNNFYPQNNKGGGIEEEVRCFKCGQQGHYAQTCPSQFHTNKNPNFQKNLNSNQQTSNSNVICWKCKEQGHYASSCPQNNPNIAGNNFRENTQAERKDFKRNYNQINGEKGPRDRKGCKICGATRHNKNSNCPGMRKRKKKEDLKDNQEEEISHEEFD